MAIDKSLLMLQPMFGICDIGAYEFGYASLLLGMVK